MSWWLVQSPFCIFLSCFGGLKGAKKNYQLGGGNQRFVFKNHPKAWGNEPF